jgi:competence protein ComEA
LVRLGLPPRPPGWVPEQTAVLLSDSALFESDECESRSGEAEPKRTPPRAATAASRVDAVRLAVAARLPDWAALRVERMSAGSFVSLVAGLVGLVLAIAVGIHHHRGQKSFESYSGPAEVSASAGSAGSANDGSSIVIDVAGKVRHPGLVTLPVGARVADAIKSAGGALRRGDLAHVDLAQRVTDGELLTVGRRTGHGASADASKLVDLSTASLTKLETLPGVGPVTAQKIVAWRTAHGGFTSVSELQQVSGIGPARYAELSPLVAP